MLQQDVQFHDDSFDFDPKSVTEGREKGQDGPLPTPGYYRVRVVSGGVKTNKDTKEMLTDKKGNPIFFVNRIAIVDDGSGQTNNGDSYGVFEDIYTNGFQPKNWKTGELIAGPKTYPFCQLLASIDATEVTADFNENIHALAKMLGTNPVITVRLGYKGTDVNYAKAQIANGVDKKAAYKAAELGASAFRNSDGTWRTEAQGPSGEMVQARLRITEWVPSNQNRDLGPLKMRQGR
jgi:hypothetical protein